MTLTVYNTMSRSKEMFETIEPNVVRMYVCGVTVYDESHIGHALMAITFDVIRRYLEWIGYEVRHAQNFTDVDDKIISRANELGITPFELSEKLIEDWHEQSEALNVTPATVYPRASREIPYMIEMIHALIEDGFAYAVDGGDVDYDVTKFAGYGKLSHQRLEDLHAGARIQVDERKQHPMDFVLWKAAKPGEPSWDSPWGPGRPGWHIECSVMAKRYLGDRIDIHGGGADLIFPHHENEIAQSESFPESRPFAHYWMHNALLEFHGDKMSKSIGNLVSTADIIAAGDAGPFRLMVLQTHYRHPLTFTEQGLEAARHGYERLVNAIRDYDASVINLEDTDWTPELLESEARFRAAMDDDFSAPIATSVLFDLARSANLTHGESRTLIQAKLLELADVLGLPLLKDARTVRSGEAAPFIELLLDLRSELRDNQQWELADKIRDQLIRAGVTVEDTADGSIWRWTR